MSRGLDSVFSSDLAMDERNPFMTNKKSLKNLKPWTKGKSGNPKGRLPMIIPELQNLIEGNRASLKAMIIAEMETKAAPWLRRIFEQGTGEGDVVRFKALLEIALGKLVEEPPEFPMSDEEKKVVLKYREWKVKEGAKI